MVMGILQRYVLVELIRVFLMALIAFTSIFVMVGLVQEATHQGLSPVQVIYLVPLVVPASLPYTIPATLLLAVTVVYGRLAADNEIMAAKSAGINVLSLIFPALLLGIVLSSVTLFLYDRLIPAANFRMRAALASNVEDMVYAVLKRDRMIKGGGLPYEIYVQDVRGKRLINTFFKRRGADGVCDLVVFAQEAALEFDLPNKLVNVHMYNAQVTDRAEEMHVSMERYKVFPIELPSLEKLDRGIRDMTLRDIRNRQAELIRSQERACVQWAFNASVSIATGHLRQARWGSLAEFVERRKSVQRDLHRLASEPHLRWSISFGCLGFVLLGCPVAILFQRGDYLSAFISCFLPIIVFYYPLVMFGLNLSKEGLAWPSVLWIGDLMLIGLSLVFIWPVLRH